MLHQGCRCFGFPEHVKACGDGKIGRGDGAVGNERVVGELEASNGDCVEGARLSRNSGATAA